MKLKIAVCDDNKEFAMQLEKIVHDYFLRKNRTVDIDIYLSGSQLLSYNGKYSIVFLDVDMKGINGIQMARRIRKNDADVIIIFVTAFVQYSLTGYQVEALRYILKSQGNLKEVVYESLEAAERHLKISEQTVDLLFQEGEKRILKTQIIYVESKLHNIEFNIWEDGFRKYTMRSKMGDVIQQIDSTELIRIHQSYLVNMRYCKKVRYDRVELMQEIMLPVSRAYSKEVRKRFHTYKGAI